MTLRLKIALTLAAGLIGLAGCTAQRNLMPDYGRSVRQDIVAQTANPDARYERDVPPAADGMRSTQAQTRYVQDKVRQPSGSTTSDVAGSGGGGGGGE